MVAETAIRIPFTRTFVTGAEAAYIARVLGSAALGEGEFTRACSKLLEQEYKVARALMTPSCTAALEMAALLCDIVPGDEVILPSYTFVSTANAFVLRGAVPVFVDIRPDTLNLDERLIERAITNRTRAIVPVHYAGVACEMDPIMEVARRHSLIVVEDAAQAIDSTYRGKPLGAIGQLGAFSFHHTKNIGCGEGGTLLLGSREFVERAEIIRDKGTNRQKYFRGEVDKYTWVSVGSSFIPSELSSAFLLAQLERRADIIAQRMAAYEQYTRRLRELEERELVRLPTAPPHCRHNAHIFYLLLRDEEHRQALAAGLRERGIGSATHYVPLHLSPMGRKFGYRMGDLPVTEDLADRLLRLPLYSGLLPAEVDEVADTVHMLLSQSLGAESHPPRARAANGG